MALKLFSGAKTRDYPARGDLLRFGKTVCLVGQPEKVIDRIATAMSETLASHRSRLGNAYGARLIEEWEHGRLTLLPARTHPMSPRCGTPAGRQRR